MKKTITNNKGFSLIELMVVVAIIGILASIAVPNFRTFQLKARQTEAKAYLNAIYTGEKAFDVEHSTFIACMEAIGFRVDGASQEYGAGFGTQTVAAAAVPSYGGACAASRGIVTAGNVDTPTTFIASAESLAASAFGGANLDAWTINQGKQIVNTISGL